MELNLKVISKDINRLMWDKEKTISTAESCSAGRIATILTVPAGSSDYFKGGLVCYTDELKTKYLNVSADLIAEKSAVNEEVAKQMVLGAITLFGSDYGIAVTGFAGPTGGTEEEPVGTVWIAVGSRERILTKKVYNTLGRDENVTLAVEAAMVLLRDFLNKEFEKD